MNGWPLTELVLRAASKEPEDAVSYTNSVFKKQISNLCLQIVTRRHNLSILIAFTWHFLLRQLRYVRAVVRHFYVVS